MKVGIVVPFSWSYIGGVSEHAEAQAEALERLGFDTRLIMGDDPPGTIWRLLHPDAGRLDRRPARVMSIGTTVTVPANNSRTHIVLSQLAEQRLRRLLKRERVYGADYEYSVPIGSRYHPERAAIWEAEPA